MKLSELSWIKTARSLNGTREIGTTNTSAEIEKWQKFILGKSVIPSYLQRVAWCGTFIAYCLKFNGVKIPTHWYRALDYRNGGTKLKKPAYGCVAVKTRGAGTGHVCFVIGRDKNTGKLACIGGNQSNKVCVALYADNEFTDFMWYGKEKQPLAGRYDLPIYNGLAETSKVSEG